MSGQGSGIEVFVSGIAAIGPGFADWPALAAILRSEVPWTQTPTVVPALQLLPPAERRRVGMLVKLSLACGMQAVSHAGADASQLATVFSASGGDGDNCHVLCAALASEDRSISPTRFHNSVHNAASGYWSIATGSMAPSTSLCAHDASFAAGLLEAAVQASASGEARLLIACDDVYGGALGAARPLLDRMAIALLLTPQSAANSLARLQLQLADAPASDCPLADLAVLQNGIPCARALPLLHGIANAASSRIDLAYHAAQSLHIEIRSTA